MLHFSGPGIPPRITLDDLGPEGLNMSGGMGGSSVLEQIAMNARGGGEEERGGGRGIGEKCAEGACPSNHIPAQEHGNEAMTSLC